MLLVLSVVPITERQQFVEWTGYFLCARTHFLVSRALVRDMRAHCAMIFHCLCAPHRHRWLRKSNWKWNISLFSLSSSRRRIAHSEERARAALTWCSVLVALENIRQLNLKFINATLSICSMQKLLRSRTSSAGNWHTCSTNDVLRPVHIFKHILHAFRDSVFFSPSLSSFIFFASAPRPERDNQSLAIAILPSQIYVRRASNCGAHSRAQKNQEVLPFEWVIINKTHFALIS